MKFDQNLADAVEIGDEAYGAVLRAGVTTVILAPAGDINAQMAAVKLGATSRDGFVLRRVAGVRYKMTLAANASRAAAAKSLESQLKKAKAYVDKLAKYETDLAAYRQAGGAEPSEADVDEEDEGDAKKSDPKEESGISRMPTLAADDKKDAKTDASKKEPKAPKKPKKDESLEPWRHVLAGDAAIVVILNREDTIEVALPVFEKYGIKPVLQDAREAHRVVDLIAKHAAGLVVAPPYEFRDRELGPVNSGRAVSAAGVPVVFYTGGTSGAQFLPLHAAFAVRLGMTKDAALKGLTVQAAELFHIADRVGTVEVGKDGDLVVFSGDPFDIASRVEVVVAGGRVVYDARNGEKR